MSAGTEARFAEILRSALHSAISAEQLAILWRHCQLLEKWNRVIGLTSIHSFEELVLRHYAESVLAAGYVSRGTSQLADIGSGAGFPGFPISVMRQEIEVTLIESSQRKAAFLRECSDLVKNLTIVNARAEDVQTHYDVITARAVRPSEVLALIGRLAPAFVLLVGAEDSKAIAESKRFICEPPIQIPWSEQTVILCGRAVLA